MYKKILLPIDLNHPESWAKALPEAVALARSSAGSLHVLTVVPDFGMTIVRDYFPENFEADALIKAKAALDAFAAENVPEDVSCETHLGHGSAAEHVLEMAGQLSADLIVLASHTPDGFRDFLVGSNADRIVHKSPISVLVTRG
jgi:nucleotide-binding universal stress UspA family protein